MLHGLAAQCRDVDPGLAELARMPDQPLLDAARIGLQVELQGEGGRPGA